MRKATILCLTAFYLLLTTGMFVCILYRTATHLNKKSQNHTVNDNSHERDNCKGEKDCDCCKKHDNFVIKENIKPGFSYQVTDNALLTYPKTDYAFIFPVAIKNTVSWPDYHSPHGKSGKLISITLRSLQI